MGPVKKSMERYGLIGQRLEHSLSPRLHGLLGDYDYRLYPLEPEELGGFVTHGDFDGLNVTLPYKQSVIPYCARLSDMAWRIGSVNTLLRQENGTLYGDNTDVFGFAFMARRAGIHFAGQKTLVLGGGGTSRSVCAVVENAGGTHVVISRQGKNNYQNLAKHADATLLVNTTPVGMMPLTDAAPLDLAAFPRLQGVLDVVYSPLRTRLLQQAQARKIPCEGGLSMLVAQAAQASELFSGHVITQERIQETLATMRQESTNLVLVGMPGAGKTTMGKALAQKLCMPLIDLDEEMEQAFGLSIAAYFARHGEAAFRGQEAAWVERYGRETGRILVTGGGAILRPKNRENLRMNGFVVHIKRPLEQLPLAGRPLSTDFVALQTMWLARKSLYEACADATVANDGMPENCVQKIMEAYHEAICHQWA